VQTSADVSSLQVHGGVLIMVVLYDTGCITRTAVGLPSVLRVPRGGARGPPIVTPLQQREHIDLPYNCKSYQYALNINDFCCN
jgi:hypothetical protein